MVVICRDSDLKYDGGGPPHSVKWVTEISKAKTYPSGLTRLDWMTRGKRKHRNSFLSIIELEIKCQ